MSDDADTAAGDVDARQARQGLAYVCAHLDEINALLADDTADTKVPDALERLRSALRDNGDITGPLHDIHDALLRAGDALGVYGHARRSGGMTLAGIEESGPLEIVYRCPAGRCPRNVPGPAVTPPRCGMSGEALRWGQL
jgi:hypothetical protein